MSTEKHANKEILMDVIECTDSPTQSALSSHTKLAFNDSTILLLDETTLSPTSTQLSTGQFLVKYSGHSSIQ